MNDTTLHGGTSCVYRGVFETDSGYFTIGQVSRLENQNLLASMLGFWTAPENPSIVMEYLDSANEQRVMSSVSELTLNHNGNFFVQFNNCDLERCFPRFLEISPTGQLVNDISFKAIFDSLNYKCYDQNLVFQSKFDSTYHLFSNIEDLNLPWGTNRGGIYYIHLGSNLQVVDTAFIHHPSYSSSYILGDALELNDGSVLLMVQIRITPPGGNPTQQNSIRFLRIDEFGVSSPLGSFQDGQMNIVPRALTLTSNGNLLFLYMKGWLDGNSWRFQNYLGKVDGNFNEMWKIRSDWRDTVDANFHNMQQDIEKCYDGNYVLAGGSHTKDSLLSSAVLSKFNEDGEFLWTRYYHKVEDNPEIPEGPAIEIYDVVQKKDSGFVLVGTLIDYEALDAGLSGQKGYILETNCLGFRGAPIAAASHTLDSNYAVNFYNTSTQAGSYQWVFGDGDTLWTDEYTDTVQHVYSGEGPFLVELIAFGCGNDRDTLNFEVYPETTEDTTVVVDAPGDFVVFPNPLTSNDKFHFYLNEMNPIEGEIYLEIFSTNGDLVKRLNLPHEGGYFELNHQFSSGIFEVIIRQGMKIRFEEKLVVTE